MSRHLGLLCIFGFLLGDELEPPARAGRGTMRGVRAGPVAKYRRWRCPAAAVHGNTGGERIRLGWRAAVGCLPGGESVGQPVKAGSEDADAAVGLHDERV